MKFLSISNFILVICVALFVCACGGKNSSSTETVTIHADSLMSENEDSLFLSAKNYSDTITIKYAKGLEISYDNSGLVLVTITNPDQSKKSSIPPAKLALCPSDKKVKSVPEGYMKVNIPVKGVICMTALQLSNFAALGCENRIVGIVSLNNLFNEKVKRQIETGKTVKIGKEGNFDVESVIAAQPDFIFISESKRGGFEQLKDCGIPLIPHHGYKETDPLGQAEWIKLVGLLVGEPQRANAVFANIETKYNSLKEEVAEKIRYRPTVVSGRQVREGWYVMGGRSYMARIFNDAGADYFMKDNNGTGGVTLDFESVYAKSINMDFWQIDGSFVGDYTMTELLAEDSRYGDLKAFQDDKVIFCNFAKTPYREMSPVEPHIMLADFVKAFHPDILPHYTPKYYKILTYKKGE